MKTAALAAVCAFALAAAPLARPASLARLHARQGRQQATIHRDQGTVRFFRRRPALARTRAGHRALRFARAQLAWTLRELAETRAALAPPVSAPSSSALASWYGPGFYGHGLACGGVLEPGTIGVAHRTLPCGTRLLVCFQGRCAAATVVDRGPYVSGRDFDLTGGLAAALRFGGVGTVTYRLL